MGIHEMQDEDKKKIERKLLSLENDLGDDVDKYGYVIEQLIAAQKDIATNWKDKQFSHPERKIRLATSFPSFIVKSGKRLYSKSFLSFSL